MFSNSPDWATPGKKQKIKHKLNQLFNSETVLVQLTCIVNKYVQFVEMFYDFAKCIRMLIIISHIKWYN